MSWWLDVCWVSGDNLNHSWYYSGNFKLLNISADAANPLGAMIIIIILSYHNIKIASYFSAFNKGEFQVGILHQPYFAPRHCPTGVPGPNSPFQKGNTALVSCSAASPSKLYWESTASTVQQRQQKNLWLNKNGTQMASWYLCFPPPDNYSLSLFLSEPYWE